jgi:hypothetical protein
VATLTLDINEEAKFKAWEKEHKKKCKLRPGTCGDLYSFNICPSGIGDFISVHCPCGAQADLTGSL